MYTASRAHDLLGDAKAKSVCEIGGGTGTLAYYLANAGMDEVWVFDLPIVSLVQAYYLMKSLGPDEVWLYGEAPRAVRVRLLPYWEFENAPERHFALVINQDSLPEIEVAAAREYVRLFREKGIGLFLSINQEARARNAGDHFQSVVSDVVARNGGFSRSYRFPHWMRAGYVEELYRIELTSGSR
jgi:putative sugar O-methyltransferase